MYLDISGEWGGGAILGSQERVQCTAVQTCDEVCGFGSWWRGTDVRVALGPRRRSRGREGAHGRGVGGMIRVAWSCELRGCRGSMAEPRGSQISGRRPGSNL